jgi:hypothetical protein
LDFSKDSRVIQSDSGSYEHLYWDVEDMVQITRTTAIRNIEWGSWLCAFGWPVKGIWPKGADGTDINAVCRSNSGTIIATSDDSGLVKLFRFPVDTGVITQFLNLKISFLKYFFFVLFSGEIP